MDMTGWVPNTDSGKLEISPQLLSGAFGNLDGLLTQMKDQEE